MALTQKEARIAEAIGQTLFQRHKSLSIDAIDADVVAYIDDYVERMAAPQALQIKALLQVFSEGFRTVARRPGHTLLTASIEERWEYMEAWIETQRYTQRMMFEALRMVMYLAYIESDVVKEAAGIGTSDDIYAGREA